MSRKLKGIAANFMKESIEDFLKKFGVAIDEPVTADIKRLIGAGFPTWRIWDVG